MSTLEQEFEALVEGLSKSAHGVKEFVTIRDFLRSKFKKTTQRKAFLAQGLLQDPIRWDFKKDVVWSTEEQKEINKFHFLQGDIVETMKTQRLGSSRSLSHHSIWMVISPDCDCVRADYVRVAPLLVVDPQDNDTHADHKGQFSIACTLGGPKYFPVPVKLFENESHDEYFVDISEPSYLHVEDKESAVVHYSMTTQAWHLLNGMLKEAETRADIDEGTRLRS